MKSTRLETPIRLLRFLIDAKGNGTPLAANFSNLWKFAFTPGP
jgi:hypothetical protein